MWTITFFSILILNFNCYSLVNGLIFASTVNCSHYIFFEGVGVTFTLFAYSIVVNFTSFNFPGKIFTISDHRWTGHHPGIKVLSSTFFPCCHLLHKSFALLNRGLCVNSTSSSHLPMILPLIQHQMILGLESMKFLCPQPTYFHWMTHNRQHSTLTCIALGGETPSQAELAGLFSVLL